MKNLLRIIVLATALLSGPFLANALCYGPGYAGYLNQTLHNMAVQKNEQQKLITARNFVQNNCFSSAELNDLLNLLSYDQDKLQLAKESYSLLSDTTGFSSLVYVFNSPNYQYEFGKFLQQVACGSNNSYRNPLQFPNYNYPNPYNYRGATSAPNFIDDRTFVQLAINLQRDNRAVIQGPMIQQYMQRYYFSVEQFMKILSLVPAVDMRFQLAKSYCYSLYDVDNIWAIQQVFGRSIYSREFTEYCEHNRGYNHGPRQRVAYTYRPACVTDADMVQIIATIKNEPFSSRRVSLAKTIIQTNPGFTSQQMATIVSQMTFDSDKLEVATFGYNFCVDQQNYYLLANSLTFSSNREKLMDYIRTHH